MSQKNPLFIGNLTHTQNYIEKQWNKFNPTFFSPCTFKMEANQTMNKRLTFYHFFCCFLFLFSNNFCKILEYFFCIFHRKLEFWNFKNFSLKTLKELISFFFLLLIIYFILNIIFFSFLFFSFFFKELSIADFLVKTNYPPQNTKCDWKFVPVFFCGFFQQFHPVFWVVSCYLASRFSLFLCLSRLHTRVFRGKCVWVKEMMWLCGWLRSFGVPLKCSVETRTHSQIPSFHTLFALFRVEWVSTQMTMSRLFFVFAMSNESDDDF